MSIVQPSETFWKHFHKSDFTGYVIGGIRFTRTGTVKLSIEIPSWEIEKVYSSLLTYASGCPLHFTIDTEETNDNPS